MTPGMVRKEKLIDKRLVVVKLGPIDMYIKEKKEKILGLHLFFLFFLPIIPTLKVGNHNWAFYPQFKISRNRVCLLTARNVRICRDLVFWFYNINTCSRLFYFPTNT